MPISRACINDLFEQYSCAVSGVRRMVERPDEILLYKNTLEACTPDEYIPVLCEIILAHLHWRISGYSPARSKLAATAVSTVSMVKNAAQRGCELLSSALQKTRETYSQVSSGQSRSYSLSSSFIAVESAIPDFPSSPVSQGSSDRFGSSVSPHRLASPFPSLSLPAMMPAQSVPLPLSPFSTTSRRSSLAGGAVSDAASSSRVASTTSRCGYAGVPSSSRRSSSPDLATPTDDFYVLDESEWSPFDTMTQIDPRILLFNEIIKHVYYSDPVVFNTHIMTVGLKKILTMPDQSDIGTCVYTHLSLPDEMRDYIQDYHARRQARLRSVPHTQASRSTSFKRPT